MALPSSTTDVVLSDRMRRLYELAERVAATPLPVLVMGETGTGKELLASALHSRSPRADRPWVTLNCAALPATLAESVLFGHERGAFTGADRQAEGAFQQASSGTLFLDEIGELPLPVQASLLRALETGYILPIGGRERRVDVRLVAATNRDLGAMVEQGGFRRDLLHRIGVVTMTVPPLRERREEIEPLCQHFLAQARIRLGSRVQRFEPACLVRLREHDWPGNVRELRNVIESSAVMSAGEQLRLDDLPASIRAPAPAPRATEPPIEADAAQGSDLRARLRAYESALLLDGLRRAGGNQCRAAELLCLPRRTLVRRIKELGLQRAYGLRDAAATATEREACH